MKKLNTQLIISFIITLLLTGCMPDSLTKFKKEPPTKTDDKKNAAAPAIPVVDPVTNEEVVFTHPAFFLMGTPPTPQETFTFRALTAEITPIKPLLSGTLASEKGQTAFITGCALVPFPSSYIPDPLLNPASSTPPSGLKLEQNCSFTGGINAPALTKVEFCSDFTTTDQTTCESTFFTWDNLKADGQKCSHADFQYNISQTACEAGHYKWYKKGDAFPYQVKLTYRDNSSPIKYFDIYTTIEIGAYSKVNSIAYGQPDKLLFSVNATPAVLSAIVPRKTTATTTGTYPSNVMLSAQNSVLGVINYVDINQKLIGVKKLVKMTLNNSSGFNAGGFISSTDVNGIVKTGKIFKKDTLNTNIIYVENISVGEIVFAKNDSANNSADFTGLQNTTITNIDETQAFSFSSAPGLDNDVRYYTQKMLMTSTPVYSYIINSTTDIKPIAPILPISENTGAVVTVEPKLPPGLTLDPVTGIITGKFLKSMSAKTYTLTVKSPIETLATTIKLTASEAPANLSLSTKQIITVTNTLFFTEGEALFSQIMPPMSEAPKGKILKILNDYQMAIDTYNGPFLESASLDSGSGFFSEKASIIPANSCVNTNYETQTDCETAGYSWSTGNVFYNLGLTLDKSTIYNLGVCTGELTISNQTDCEEERIWDVATATCSNSAYLTQPTCEVSRVWEPTTIEGITSGAKGLLAGMFKEGTYDILYIRHITGAATGVSTAKAFEQSEKLLYSTTVPGTEASIVEIDSNFIKLDLTLATNFKVGSDVTLTKTIGADIVPQSGGYIYKKSGSSIYVSDTSRAPGSISIISPALAPAPGGEFFRAPKVAGLPDTDYQLYPDSDSSGALNTTITKVSHDVMIVAERNQKIVLNTSLSAGQAIYSISPQLPAGLTLNTTTGVISGTPTTITPKKDFVLKAINFLDSATYVFSMEVRDYFTISDASGAPSFILHKIGETQGDRKCRVNASDILGGVTPIDIRCMLDGQEQDIYYYSLKLKASVGAGVCEYVQYDPYYFWQYAPLKSVGTSSQWTVGQSTTPIPVGCGAGTLPTADLCDGNYSKRTPVAGPNCDEGKLAYVTQPRKSDGGMGCLNDGAVSAVQYVQCGGIATKCIAGPVTDILTTANLTAGYSGVIAPSSTGFNTTWTATAPRTLGFKTTIKNANFTSVNQCSTSKADMNTWAIKAATTPSTDAPYGSSRPYYQITCLNSAKQIKARIRLVVREWNRDFKINNGIDMVDPKLTLTGVPGDDIGSFMDNNSTDDYGYPYNDYSSLDNDYTNKGTCTVGTLKTEYACLLNGETWTPAGPSYAGPACGDNVTEEYPFAEVSL